MSGNKSKSFKVTSGVAQGSRLGPLLFAIFVNDLVEVVKFANIELFADDCRLNMKILSPQDAHKLQEDINNVDRWIRNNKLQVNGSKCQKITFSRASVTMKFEYKINDVNIEESESVRDLGVVLDCKWSFLEHINTVIAKFLKTIRFIKKTTAYFSDPEVIIYLFKYLVLPGLNYGSVIWSPYLKKDIDKLNMVITNFLRYISYKKGKPMAVEDHNYKNISIECKLFKIETVHKINDIFFIIDNMRNKINTPNFAEYFKRREENYYLRWHQPFKEDILKKDYIINAPIHRLVRSWNDLMEKKSSQLLEDTPLCKSE